MPGVRTICSVDIDAVWASVIAMAARNWMEDLHAAGAFSDRQAPGLNRAIRNRVYEALMAWRRCDPARVSNRFTTYLCNLATDGDPEWPRTAVSGAISRAIGEFAAIEFIKAETAAALEQAASAGAQSTVSAPLRFDEQAQRQIAYLINMIPRLLGDARDRSGLPGGTREALSAVAASIARAES